MKNFLYNILISKIYKLLLQINFKMQEFDLKENDRCLCIAPHPDDESIGAAGILLKNPEKFKVVCVTDGQRGSEKYSKEEIIRIRKEEFKSAMEYANIKDWQMLDIPDKHVIDNYNIFKSIDISSYDYIFIPNILDQHQDHKAVCINLAKLLKDKKYKKNVKIMMYEVWSSLPLPNSYTDIKDIKENKKEMINKHKSQVESLDYTNKIVELNSYRALQVFKECIEAYMMIDVKTLQKMVKWTRF